MAKPNNNAELFILAVEDDALYAESLEITLQELGYTSFIIVDNAADALKIFKSRQPDIMLMDISIRGPLNGIEFVEIISAIRPTPVIYVTSFTDKQVFEKAKLTAPSAYVIKPYHSTSLQAAIELALPKNAAGLKTADSTVAHQPEQAAHLFIKYNNKLLKLDVDDLLYIEVDEKYCHLHTTARRYAVNIRLKNLLEQLPGGMVVQTHRSFAVKLNVIDEVNLEENTIKICGKEIPVGKTYRDAFFARLKTI